MSHRDVSAEPSQGAAVYRLVGDADEFVQHRQACATARAAVAGLSLDAVVTGHQLLAG